MPVPEPIIDPPALYRAADEFLDADTWMSEARVYGRKTVQDAIETGKCLIHAKEQCLKANNGKKGKWLELLAKYGFSRTTAFRLILKARNAELCSKMEHSPEFIYDDGQTPPDVSDKLRCRD